MQVNQASYQAQQANITNQSTAKAPTSLDSFSRQPVSSKTEVGYQKLGTVARFKRHQFETNVDRSHLEVHSDSHELDKTTTASAYDGLNAEQSADTEYHPNHTETFTDLDGGRPDLSVESTPQATLEKAQEIQHQLLTHTDPTVHNPQLIMKAQLLERRAKAQLHKDQMTKRFVKAPRLI